MRTCLRVTAVLAGLLPCLAMSSDRSPSEALEAFPEAAQGMVRWVIHLPEMPRPEEDYSVELVVGRIIRTDGVNLMRMDTVLKERPLEGWGYTYYEMTGNGRTSSTLMAPPEGAPQVDAFVHGPPLRIRYNSRLPVVVYAPVGFELRYRIWAAAEEFLTAGEG